MKGKAPSWPCDEYVDVRALKSAELEVLDDPCECGRKRRHTLEVGLVRRGDSLAISVSHECSWCHARGVSLFLPEAATEVWRDVMDDKARVMSSGVTLGRGSIN